MKDVIKMARESRLDVYGLGKDHLAFVAALQRFAVLVRKDERALAEPAQEFVCSTGLCHYKPAAPDLQAELDATNRQVEILSDALAESRRQVAALQELNT